MYRGFTRSDGWLLCSLWGAAKPIDRPKLNQVGDMFNHAIFDDDEVADGMHRLTASGLAFTTEDGLYAISDRGKAFVDLYWQREVGHIKNMFAIQDHLQAINPQDLDRLLGPRPEV